MNIFVLDTDPILAAQAHCDTHVVKMILETAQLLSTAWHETHNAAYIGTDAPGVSDLLRFVARPAANPKTPPAPVLADGSLRAEATARDMGVWLLANQRIYRRTHSAHPCAVWARASCANYAWLWRLGMALLAEYTYRYGKTHATTDVMRTLELPPELPVTGHVVTPFAQAMPEELRCADAVRAYRRYYTESKRELLRYTRRAAPTWPKV
jgi:hypothetical protein